MKRVICAALLAALLCGCGGEAEPTETTAATQATQVTEAPTETAETVAQTPTLPAETDGSVTTFTLESGNCAGILRFGESSYALLTTDGQMTLLTGGDMQVENSRDLGCQLTSDDPSILVKEDQISYYDRSTGAYITLGKNLTQISAITIRDTITAGPIMSADFSTIYYCTDAGIRALDMATGNSRLLRQEHQTIVNLDGLLFDGTNLQYTRQITEDRYESCFIRTDDGSQTYVASLDGELTTWGTSYAAVMNLELPMGTCRQILTGDLTQGIQDLNVDDSWDTILFPGDGTALLQTVTEEGVRADLYDLTGGTLSASRVFVGRQSPFLHAWAEGGCIWLWTDEESLLHRWDASMDASTAGTSLLTPHYTLGQPNETGIEQCSLRAQALTDTFGIPIRIAAGSNRTTGVDYSGYPDYRPQQYLAALNQLHEALDRFPDGMLALLGGDGKLVIELVDDYDPTLGVREGTGELEFGSPRVIRVSICQDLQSIFYHELYHAMELVIQSATNDLEDWSDLNPSKFDYTGSYTAYENGEYADSEYLEEGDNDFADGYCLVSPREDRAQTFMYAMMEGQQARFDSKTMQKKLELISEAIRETFEDYEDSEDVFAWEQYLDTVF